MKRNLLILASVIFFSCCGVKESTEDSAKWKSDLQARIIVLKDSLTARNSTIVSYQDSLRECQEGNRQLHHWIEKK